jgi:hypothetical protein
LYGLGPIAYVTGCRMPDVVVVSDEQGAGIVFFRSSAFTDFFFHEICSNNVISSMAF